MARILILDDDPKRHDQFRKNYIGHNLIHVHDADTCIEALIENSLFDVIFLDHDLGGRVYVGTDEHNTGSTVAKWLAENPSKCSENIIIHSLNPAGRQNMKAILPHAIEYPFAWTQNLIKEVRE